MSTLGKLLSEGERRGEARGRVITLPAVTRKRLCMPPAHLVERLQSATIEGLDRLTERVLDGATFDDL